MTSEIDMMDSLPHLATLPVPYPQSSSDYVTSQSATLTMNGTIESRSTTISSLHSPSNLRDSLSSSKQKETVQSYKTMQHSIQELFSLFTCFYAMFLTIVGLIIELSHIFNEQLYAEDANDMIYAVYMYGGSLLFFIYCYSVLLKTGVSRALIGGVRRATVKLDPASSKDTDPIMIRHATPHKDPKATHSSVRASTGSLYLRLGCVVFGIFGIVYYGLILSICAFGGNVNQDECNVPTLVVSGFASVFIFVQMHFIFCNSKITVHGSLKIARLGMMHLVATNLWTWMRYILLEEESTTLELSHASFTPINYATLNNVTERKPEVEEICKGVRCVLGNSIEFVYTCVVEYAMVCAGVSFVFWTNVGRGPSTYQKLKLRRANVISIDCSRTTTGLFCGFVIIAFTFICIAIFNAYVTDEKSKLLANTLFFSTDGVLLLCSLVAIVFAFWRMRKLNFKKEEGDIDESAELLDRILLVVGLVGELIFSIGGIMSLAHTGWTNLMIVILLVVQVIRLFQVVLQSALLLIGGKLKAASQELRDTKPGKQVVTFLLIINIALFIMNTVEAQKAGVTEDIVRYYGSKAWALLVRGCSPLNIFYRFHSSVCFAEIWKHSYKIPHTTLN
ncbi:hypothetical protein AB6A40_002223 [Gnathostoma spinigerum]|uniref:Uncharacterized protein n=1 Tax=Gnathostoma spinigerum TaxID=75299 RepID=A0ABD6EDT4_9BILA